MPTTTPTRKYEIAYRREQRHYFEVAANTEAEALEKAEAYIATLDLVSTDDQSDDPGEVEATAAIFGVWDHLESRQVVNYAEGDLYVDTYETVEELVGLLHE